MPTGLRYGRGGLAEGLAAGGMRLPAEGQTFLVPDHDAAVAQREVPYPAEERVVDAEQAVAIRVRQAQGLPGPEAVQGYLQGRKRDRGLNRHLVHHGRSVNIPGSRT